MVIWGGGVTDTARFWTPSACHLRLGFSGKYSASSKSCFLEAVPWAESKNRALFVRCRKIFCAHALALMHTHTHAHTRTHTRTRARAHTRATHIVSSMMASAKTKKVCEKKNVAEQTPKKCHMPILAALQVPILGGVL